MPNWDDMFAPTTPVLEVVLRATIIYLGLVLLLRLIGQRESGGMTMTDLLVVILVGTGAGHMMAVDRLSIPEGFVLVATLLGWSLLLDALAYRFPRLGRLLKARPRPLIEDGRVNTRALRRELISREELREQLRLHGVEDEQEVSRAYLEPNGMVSVFSRQDDERSPRPSPSS